MTYDGSICISGSYDNTVRVWNVSDGTPLHILEEHTDTVLFLFDESVYRVDVLTRLIRYGVAIYLPMVHISFLEEMISN